MPPQPRPFNEIPKTRKTLTDYSGLDSIQTYVMRPAHEDEIVTIFTHAIEHGKKVTLRGGAHAFDSQSLGADFVISMEEFAHINDPVKNPGDEWTITVGPAATWGAIVEKLEQSSLIPEGTVTSSEATPGGTIAADCLSRFSPAYGKEGTKVKRIKLVTPTGQKLECHAPDGDTSEDQWTDDQRICAAVIGGLGYLGAVTEVTILVREVEKPRPDAPIRMTTTIKMHDTFTELADELVDLAHGMDIADADPNDSKKVDAIYCGIHAGRFGGRSAMLFRSTVTPGAEPLRQMLLHRRSNILVPFGFLVRSSLLNWLMWKAWGRVAAQAPYVDEFADYLFFMDTDAKVKGLGRKLGFKMNEIQQTFVIPADASDRDSWGRTKIRLSAWLTQTHECMMQKGLTPTMLDVMYLPADMSFPLSCTYEKAGFCVSYAFETSSKAKLEKIDELFVEFSDLLERDFHGRVSLVKNVRAKRETLRKMYCPQLNRFLQVKADLDPHCVLYNEFLYRTFGDLEPCQPPLAPPATGQEQQTLEVQVGGGRKPRRFVPAGEAGSPSVEPVKGGGDAG